MLFRVRNARYNTKYTSPFKGFCYVLYSPFHSLTILALFPPTQLKMSVMVRPAGPEDMETVVDLIRLLAVYEKEESQVEVRFKAICEAQRIEPTNKRPAGRRHGAGIGGDGQAQSWLLKRRSTFIFLVIQVAILD